MHRARLHAVNGSKVSQTFSPPTPELYAHLFNLSTQHSTVFSKNFNSLYTSHMQEMHCLVSGTVQNVAYRVYVQDSATELGIVGFVRNLPSGMVEVVAQGQTDILKEFVEYLHEGSLLSKVDSVEIVWRTPKHHYQDFSIKHG